MANPGWLLHRVYGDRGDRQCWSAFHFHRRHHSVHHGRLGGGPVLCGFDDVSSSKWLESGFGILTISLVLLEGGDQAAATKAISGQHHGDQPDQVLHNHYDHHEQGYDRCAQQTQHAGQVHQPQPVVLHERPHHLLLQLLVHQQRPEHPQHARHSAKRNAGLSPPH